MTSPLSDALSDAVCTYVRPSSLSFQVTSSRSRCMVVCITNVHTYVHACEPENVPTQQYLHYTESQAMHSYMCTTNFSSRKKQKSVSTVHYPLQQLVCVFVLTWSSKSSKSLKAHYFTSLNQQMKDELVRATYEDFRACSDEKLDKLFQDTTTTYYLTTTTHPNSYCGTQHRHQTYQVAILSSHSRSWSRRYRSGPKKVEFNVLFTTALHLSRGCPSYAMSTHLCFISFSLYFFCFLKNNLQ